MRILWLASLILAQQLNRLLAHPTTIIQGTTVKPGFQRDMGKLGKLEDDVAALFLIEPYVATPVSSLLLDYSIN